MDDDEIIDIGGEESVQDTPASVSSAPLPVTVPALVEEPVMSLDTWDSNAYKFQAMDDDSRALIEQMLAEEEFYYGNNTLDTLSKRKTKGAPKKKNAKRTKMDDPDTEPKSKAKKLEGAVSSASLPSHKTRWTVEEDEMLRSALDKYGYGNWKPIAEHVRSRNPLQCKNHARHWLLSDKIDGPSRPKTDESQDAAQSELSEDAPSAVPPDSTDESEEGDDISVEDNDASQAELAPAETTQEPNTDTDQASQKDDTKPCENEVSTYSKDLLEIAKQAPTVTADNAEPGYSSSTESSPSVNSSPEKVPKEESEPLNTPQQESMETIIPPIKEEDTDMVENEGIDNTSTDSKLIADASTDDNVGADLIQRDTETLQSIFDRHVASEEEQLENPEWFCNNPPKTPERYLRIRNHILDGWRKCQPRYLTKTSVRKGLKDCGDVNAIGRVHTYLESVGAINTDCVRSAPRPPKRIARDVDDDEDTNMLLAADLVIGYDGPRKRKVRNEQGDWVDPKELEGRVIEHGQEKQGQTTRPKRIIRQPQHYYGGDDFGRGYDPFRLVPLLYYGEEEPAPFTVDIISDALLVMDFHSHLAETEIIGLLGGNFVEGDQGKTLKVECVFPCRSTSTGIQCEMDPASEMKAREVFSDKGYTVVGWYHSHPTFEPQPSIRDIENQTSYQTLFRHDTSGDEPFIGVIVTPYDPDTLSEHSAIQYLHISRRWNEAHSFRKVRQSEQVSPEVMHQIRELVDEFKGYEHKMDMMSLYGSQTRLDKLLEALRANVFLETDQVTRFLNDVRDIMMKDFVKRDPPDQQANSDTAD